MKNILITTIAAVVLVGCGEPSDFHKAAGAGNIEVVKQHLAAGADVNAIDRRGWTPLHQADVRKKRSGGWTPLHYAAYWGGKEIAELLIAKGASVNAKGGTGGGTPLHKAAWHGHKEIAELLIAKGVDVNATDMYRRTPLDLAIQQKQTADLLRKHGGKTKKELEAEGK